MMFYYDLDRAEANHNKRCAKSLEDNYSDSATADSVCRDQMGDGPSDKPSLDEYEYLLALDKTQRAR